MNGYQDQQSADPVSDEFPEDRIETFSQLRRKSKPVTDKKPLKIELSYPWLSPVSSLALMGAFIALQQTDWFYSSTWFGARLGNLAIAALAVIVGVTLIYDIRRFFLQQRTTQKNIEKLEQELQYAWQSRKRLQQRSHIYSDHADKLKRFISDRLIEQIEYDEKFLHFKSIAAEIRHNGVISYDIVRAALEHAATEENQQLLMQGSLSDTHRFGLPNNPNSGSQQALQAMKYLWDLLDLSTTDNIALHIGNQLIESEERYYQIELNRSEATAVTEQQSSGAGGRSEQDMPIFLPGYAAIKAMGPYLQTDQMDHMIEQVRKAYYADLSQSEVPEFFESDQFRIQFDRTEHLLGNENHLILLLENLVKNAQFFSGKTRFRQKTDRIAVQLLQRSGCIEFSVYNRGPHIRDEDKEQIFQLGYSTRRAKEHHGKGLGLFFVSEIVKGYQGTIQIENIDNREYTSTVRVALADGKVFTKVIERHNENGRPMLRELNDTNSAEALTWEFSAKIDTVEVSATVYPRTHVFADFEDSGTTLLDPASPFMPEWTLEVTRQSRKSLLKYSALDIKGARFSVRLPTAESRLHGEDPDLD